jgi:hypothetical protein
VIIPNATEKLDLGTSKHPEIGRTSSAGDDEIASAMSAFASARNQIFNQIRYSKLPLLLLLAILLVGCGYHFESFEPQGNAVTISVPYIKNDPEGKLGAEIIQALASSGQFDCVQTGGVLSLEVAILAEGDERIGYRFDRNPTSGKLRDNIVGTENRLTASAEVKLIDTYTNETVMGPQVVKAYADYDYVDSNSVRDLTFLTPEGKWQKVLDFSLGQLDSVEGAHDDARAVIYRHLAQKIVNGIIVHSGVSGRALRRRASTYNGFLPIEEMTASVSWTSERKCCKILRMYFGVLYTPEVK